MSNYYIGDNCSNISIDEPWAAVSQVAVKVDDNHIYYAGTTTGRTMNIDCPIGSQAIADSLLSIFNGFVYRAYDATDALIKPSLELGDAVSIGGIYSIVGGLHIEGDAIFAADISAPSSGDIDHEYPYDEFKRVVVAAKNIKHGGRYGTMHGSGITGHSLTTDETDENINQSLADADYSADVFAGAVTADYGKFSYSTIGNLSLTTLNYKSHAAQWRLASDCVQYDRYVLCYIGS